jgi:hypothetical protein
VLHRDDLTNCLYSSTVIDELTSSCGTDQSPEVAYFYFTNKQTTSDLALRSLIRQMSLATESIPDALEGLYSQYSEYPDGQQSPTRDDLMSTLKSIIESIPHPYIILDALNECEDGDELLTMITEIHGWGYGSLHLLATSRSGPEITDVMDSLDSSKVLMDENVVLDDIRIHVQNVLYRGTQFRKWSQEAKEKIETTLISNANGMYCDVSLLP